MTTQDTRGTAGTMLSALLGRRRRSHWLSRRRRLKHHPLRHSGLTSLYTASHLGRFSTSLEQPRRRGRRGKRKKGGSRRRDVRPNQRIFQLRAAYKLLNGGGGDD
ncbi:hypothetical protein J6590_005739 [Homalodisca vitripennis]|nr:hypothetical protein J6590_005739 [Homalodisca vitripennis]